MPNSLDKWLRATMERKRISQADLAREMTRILGREIRRDTVNKMVSPSRKRRNVKVEELAAIEAILGEKSPIDSSQAEPGHQFPVVEHAPNATVTGRLAGGHKTLPVYGHAVGGIEGEFPMNGNVVEYVFAPPGLDPENDAYGVIVRGDSMEPRYFDGEKVFVDPRRMVRRNDFVVAQIRSDLPSPPWAYIKRLVRWNNQELVLAQYNPVKEITFQADSVVSVHLIVMGGVGAD